MIALPTEAILSPATVPMADAGEVIGESREGRPLHGLVLGHGPLRISLIGGCHADEPVGPEMLRLLTHQLGRLPDDHPLLAEIRWHIVPHVNPDGARRNAGWSEHSVEVPDHRGARDVGFDPLRYVRRVAREPPGDDIEFGFPRQASDGEARPENLAVARFMEYAAPLHLHGSFHGMGFAPGPWFLIEAGWSDRTLAMRQALRRRVRTMGYPLFDIDRRGEKGFHRIDEGFCTRPDSVAMREHFLAQGDRTTAARFRPSSMELAGRLGDDPLTLVSEMPLFLIPAAGEGSQGPAFRSGTAGRVHLLDQLGRIAAELPAEKARREFARLGIRAMPIRDQMRLQLAFLEEAVRAVQTASPGERRPGSRPDR
jgi:hypothetical protein